MTKEEMLSLGVPTDKVKDLQNMYFHKFFNFSTEF